MLDRLAALIVGEGNWLPVAMVIAAACAVSALKHSRLAAMNLFVGVTLLVMGSGHVLAVTTKMMQGTLSGSAPLLYAIGVAILVPAGLLVGHARGTRSPQYNFWMVVVLVLLGLINIPLAIPALLNIAYARHSKPLTGRIIAGAWTAVVAGLFVGGMLFLLSGAQTFEEFAR